MFTHCHHSLAVLGGGGDFDLVYYGNNKKSTTELNL